MQQFSNLEIKQEKVLASELKKHPTLARYSLAPLPNGFGHTVGNSLRRVLLSAITGAAITSVRINDVLHEFETIDGVKQNLLHLVLGMKGIRFTAAEEKMYVITLSAKGVSKITAKDFKVPEGLEVVNPEHHIADLTDKKAELNIEAVVELGVGYRDRDEALRDEVGRIPLDADFSPVKVVSYNVEKTRQGDIMNLDKITLDIVTDGSMTGGQALLQALEILKSNYETLHTVGTVALEEDTKKSSKKKKAKKTAKKKKDDKKTKSKTKKAKKTKTKSTKKSKK